MALVNVPAVLRSQTADEAEVPVDGETVGVVLDKLVAQYPGIRGYLYDDGGNISRQVTLYVRRKGEDAGDSIEHLQGLETPLGENDCLSIFYAISGG